jgi:hypothetical protein
LRHTQSFDEFINFVFPSDILADPAIGILRAILSPYNVFVDEFNEAILQNVPGESHCYISNDSIEAEDSSNVFSDPEFLKSLREPGIPPHELILKKGAICQLTRNFDAFRFDEVFSILWVLSLLFVRETKGRTLEELNQVFALPMRAHAAYGLRQVPYGFRKFC